MTVTHEAHQHQPGAEQHAHRDENWNDEDFVAAWLERQQTRPDRPRQFQIIRALIPKTPDQEFRYINLGAGPGHLDEVLLQHFPASQATLVDQSLLLLGAARQRLAGFGDRVEYVRANLGASDWTGAVSGPFDVAVSTLAVHNFGDARRIREVYADIYRLLGHGGMFLNLDYVRPSRPSLAPLSQWVERVPEAGLSGRGSGQNMPGSLLEHLGWLGEAGFPNVEVFWKDMNTAVMCGIRDHLHLPDGHAAETGHAHGHAS